MVQENELHGGFDCHKTISRSKYRIFTSLKNWKVFEICDVFVMRHYVLSMLEFVLKDECGLQDLVYMMCVRETKSQYRCHLTVVLREFFQMLVDGESHSSIAKISL